MAGLFEDHLALDAIVAYVDGELSPIAQHRAAAHLAGCPSCSAEVAEQSAVQQMMRSASLPRMPGSLFDSLAAIPLALPATPQTPVVPGLDLDAHGRVRPRAGHGVGRSRRLRFGAGALVAGLAVGALVTTGPEPDTDRNGPDLPGVAEVRSP